MKPTCHILTYPRVGSHYLQKLMENKLGVRCHRSHYAIFRFLPQVMRTDTIITIARNPFDAIASELAQNIMHFPDIVQSHTFDYIEKMISTFIVDTERIYNLADIMVKFDDLQFDEDLLLSKLSKALDVPILENDSKVVLSDAPGANAGSSFLVTSRELPEYALACDLLSAHDLTKANELYLDMLARSL